MKGKQSYSRGVAVVALMALSKREFFQRLLESPSDALAGVREQLDLTDADVKEITEIVDATRASCPTEQLHAHWDHWREDGVWGGGRGGWITFGGWPCV